MRNGRKVEIKETFQKSLKLAALNLRLLYFPPLGMHTVWPVLPYNAFEVGAMLGLHCFILKEDLKFLVVFLTLK